MVPAPKLALTTGVVRIEGLVVLVLTVRLHFRGGIVALKLILPAAFIVLEHKHEEGLNSRGNVWF